MSKIETAALAVALLLAASIAAVARNDQVGNPRGAGSASTAMSHSAITRPTARASPPIAARNRAPACKSNKTSPSRLLLPLPPSRVGIPDAIGEQAIQVREVWVTVDEEVQAFAIVLARPLAVPRLPPRIVRVEVQAPERLPAAMATAFDIAARAMAFADRHAAIGAWFELLARKFSRTWPVATVRESD